MSHTAVTLQVFMSGQDDIIVKADWEPHPHEPMPQMPGCFIGKKFGAGALAFNRIFDLVDQNGRSTGLALKVCRPTLAARRSLAHEWKMFKDLSLLANDFAAARSHFLQAERVVRLGDGKIAGIVMEKANGQNVDKTLKDPKFCNVRYVIALLRDLLVGLDVAQRVLGFTHYDLKLDNVMEHWNCDPDGGKARLMIDAVPQFKIFDFGTAVVYPDPFAVRRVVDDHLEGHHPDAAPQLAEQHPHNRRGNITRSNRGPYDYEYSTPFLCVRIYHLWWKQRGDVFRVLSALCKHLDDRTWPLEDVELVSLLFTVLEHTTNSRRLRARFEPRQGLLQRLYGPHPPPPYAPQGSTTTSSPGLSKQQSEALIRQHSQVVLQGSMGMLASQGSSSQLPSPAAIEAFSKQQRQQQRQHKQPGGGAALQGVAEADGEAEEELPRTAAPPILRINTTKIPAATAAAPAGVTPAAAAAAGGSAYPAAGTGGPPSTPPSTPPAGGQYTPRRSTEVPREELSSFPVAGMAYVRLAKVPPAAGAAAAGPAATSASTPSPAPPSPFAVSGAQGTTGFTAAWGQQGLAETGSSGEGGTGAGGGYRGLVGGGSSSGSSYTGTPVAAGVQQMVSGASPEQRRRQQERISAPLLQQQQQQQQQYDSRVASNSSSSAGPQQQRRHEAVAAATAAAGAAAAVPKHEEYVLETAPTGVPDPFAHAPAGVSSGAPPHLRTGQDNSSSGAARRQDSAATIVAKQPVAAAPMQSVLGSRKALRGVTAQQLLVEPVVQSLLSKV